MHMQLPKLKLSKIPLDPLNTLKAGTYYLFVFSRLNSDSPLPPFSWALINICFSFLNSEIKFWLQCLCLEGLILKYE